MTHINKQLEVNINFSKPSRLESKYSNVELYCTILLIVLGSVGLYFYTSILSPKKSDITFSSLTTNTFELIKKDLASTTPIEGASTSNLEKLIVKGHPEAGEKLMIIIDAYDENANYNIAFGDGASSTTTKEKIEHIYSKPGNYTIELNVTYDNEQLKKVVKEVITIDEAIEVIEEAYTEM